MLSPFSDAPVDADEAGCGREKPATHSGTPMERRQLVAAIERLAREGHSAAEIAEQLSENPRRVIRVARLKKIKLAGRGGYRKVHCGIRRRHYEKLTNLAGVMQVSNAAALERVLTVTLDRSMQTILKDLGKEALPKRKYSPRQKARVL